MSPSRRKKWTEVEERTLIDKYGEMLCDGTLAKMKTREKKYKPIALHVNSIHHACDPITYPWQWTWKDVSTKVQNMRHQYSLVKQKIKKHDFVSDSGMEEFDWLEGITHWSNFLRYKEVFGDVALIFNVNDSLAIAAGDDDDNGEGFDGCGHGMGLHFGDDGDFASGFDGGDNGVMGLDFEYDGDDQHGTHDCENNQLKDDGDNGFVYEDAEPSGSETKKKRKFSKGVGKRGSSFLANQLRQLRELEIRFESREMERDGERRKREKEHEKKWEKMEKEREEGEESRERLRRQRLREWEAMERETEERQRKRREDEREWEERIHRRRSEWKKKMDEMLSQHRVEMGQIQTRILHEQQNLSAQLIGIVSQWTGQATGLSDQTTTSNHYLSQMMQSLHHVTGIVNDDARVGGDSQEDQFIVD